MHLLSYGALPKGGFAFTSRWLMLPAPLYFSLLFLSLLLTALSGGMLIEGLIRKKPRGHFIRWGAVLLLSALYLLLALGTQTLIANTMVGG